MTYCTQQNLVDRFGESELISLTDRTDSGVIDATVLGVAITDTDSEIDSYLLPAGYSLPLDAVPPVLTAFACDLVRYRLYDEQPTETVQTRADTARKFLREIKSGAVSLGVTAEDASSEMDAQYENGRDSVFTGGGY